MKVYMRVEGTPKDVSNEIKEHLVRKNVKFAEKEVDDGYVVALMDAVVKISYGPRDDEAEIKYYSSTLSTFNEYILPAIQREVFEIRVHDAELETDTYCDCGCGYG